MNAPLRRSGVVILVLALPAYLLMRRHWEVTWWNAALAGFLVLHVVLVLLSGPVRQLRDMITGGPIDEAA